MNRYLNIALKEHLKEDRQMIFLAGPRQVGKTFVAKNAFTERYEVHYLNWDNLSDRTLILSGPEKVASRMMLSHLSNKDRIVIFDEIHKYPQWKNYIKGFFDSFGEQCKIIITGSARLDIYKKGGDSLMGRYFPYRLHPLSVRELLNIPVEAETEISPPAGDGVSELIDQLYKYGGFPEPFIKGTRRFHTRWKRLRFQQLFNEDIRTIADMRNISQLELMAELLRLNPGQLTPYSSLAKRCCVSIDTIKRWLNLLENLYYCFRVTPWHKNISRSLTKESKFYLYDWSSIDNSGARIENMIAAHLLKALSFWQDIGIGEYSLHFLRDKEKHEADFLILKNSIPWILLEVKKSPTKELSKSLMHFQKQINAEHVFQVAYDMPFVDKDCFQFKRPMIVPATTFLSQLV